MTSSPIHYISPSSDQHFIDMMEYPPVRVKPVIMGGELCSPSTGLMESITKVFSFNPTFCHPEIIFSEDGFCPRSSQRIEEGVYFGLFAHLVGRARRGEKILFVGLFDERTRVDQIWVQMMKTFSEAPENFEAIFISSPSLHWNNEQWRSEIEYQINFWCPDKSKKRDSFRLCDDWLSDNDWDPVNMFVLNEMNAAGLEFFSEVLDFYIRVHAIKFKRRLDEAESSKGIIFCSFPSILLLFYLTFYPIITIILCFLLFTFFRNLTLFN